MMFFFSSCYPMNYYRINSSKQRTRGGNMKIKKTVIILCIVSLLCITGVYAANGNPVFCKSIPEGTLLDKATVAIAVVDTEKQFVSTVLTQEMIEGLSEWVPQEYIEDGFYLIVGDGTTGNIYNIGEGVSTISLVSSIDRTTVSTGRVLQRTRSGSLPQVFHRDETERQREYSPHSLYSINKRIPSS